MILSKRLTNLLYLGICSFVLMGAGAVSAATYPISWLDMSPTAIGAPVPNGSVINVAGIGNVTVTYSVPSHWTHSRAQIAAFTTGSVVAGPDTYQWNNYEYFSTIFTTGELGPETCTITYIFPATLAAGTVFVGTIGLGATTSFGGGISSTTVNQNGTFLGDFIGDPTAGASLFIGGAGTFTVQNSVTGAGGINPWWNTHLGVIRIDDAVASLTIHQSALRGDGIGATIGFFAEGTVGTESASWGNIKSLFR